MKAATILLGVLLVGGVSAQPHNDAAVHYALSPNVLLFHPADTTLAFVSLAMREEVFVLEVDSVWARVRTADGAEGFVRRTDLANTWIRVSKRDQTVYVYRGAELLERIPADLGSNFFAEKTRKGSLDDPDHWRTPEGVFYVAKKNAASRYHRALVISYPNEDVALRGLRDSLITPAQFDAIQDAHARFAMPPMNTALGGWIEIHGHGTGRRLNWTQGCIAVRNDAIDRLWALVHVGTPVVIDP